MMICSRFKAATSSPSSFSNCVSSAFDLLSRRRLFMPFALQKQQQQQQQRCQMQQLQLYQWFTSTTSSTNDTDFKMTNNKIQQQQGYQSIGSFHSEKIHDLLMRSDGEYIPPKLPFIVETMENDNDITEPITDTHINKYRKDFLLDLQQWTFLNHGAFGASLKIGHDRANSFRNLVQEQQPLQYYDRILLPHLVHTVRLLCNLLTVPNKEHVVLLPNVTTGLNTIFANHTRCMKEEENSIQPYCIVWDTTYGSVKKMVQHYYSKKNVIEIPFQANYFTQLSSSNNTGNTDAEQVFIDAIDDCIQKYSDTFFDTTNPSTDKSKSKKHFCFVLDHITSNTALTMPIQRMAKYIKERIGYHNCIVIVDGAHGLFNYEINIKQLFDSNNIDVYVTNGHKWFCTPKGVAIMALNSNTIMNHPILQKLVERPNIISHGVDEGDILSRYIWDGCRDYNAALSVPAVIEYWKSNYHINHLRLQCRTTLVSGVQQLIRTWYPKDDIASDSTLWSKAGITLTDVHSSVLSSLMMLVRLPPISIQKLLEHNNNDNTENDVTQQQVSNDNNDDDHILLYTSVHAKMVQDYLYNHSIEVPIKCINHVLYVRVSCHLYNTIHDFTILAQCIDTIIQKKKESNI